MHEIPAHTALRAGAILAEGPTWDVALEVYWWIDIEARWLCRFDPRRQENRVWNLDQMPGCVVGRRRGGLMMAVQHGFAEFDAEIGALRMVADPEAELPENRFNDGKCDPAGRFWAGTMRIDDHMRQITGALYALDASGRVVKHLDDVGVSNGLAWSGDGQRMYFIDSARYRIDVFDFDAAAGRISGRRCLFQSNERQGAPDGMAIDVEDKLWVAFWGGGCVARICPERGEVLARVAVPAAQVTSCAFGGPQLDQLLITTASIGLDAAQRAQQPGAGDLFMAYPGVAGVAPQLYAG